MEIGQTLNAESPEDFEAWLEEYGRTHPDIWVIVYKKTSGKQRVSFAEVQEAALCYGWVDDFTKAMDDDTYVVRFTPRRKKSSWSEYNRSLARRLLAEGRVTSAGKAVLPDDLRATG